MTTSSDKRTIGSLLVGGTLVAIGSRPESEGRLVIDLPEVLGRFHVTHPLVTFRLRTAQQGSAGHLAAVAADELDLALVGTIDQPAGVRRQRLGSVRFSFEAADQTTALGLVRNRLGVTLLPRIGSEGDGVSVIEVEGADLDLTVAVWPRRATGLPRQLPQRVAPLVRPARRGTSRRCPALAAEILDARQPAGPHG